MKLGTIVQSDCNVWQKVDFIRQPEMTSSVVRLRKCSKALSQNQTCTKKRIMATVLWSAAGLIHYHFLHPSNTVTCVLSKSMRCTENPSVCSQHWSTERAPFFSTETMPNHTSHNQRVKCWTNWAMKFCLICYIYLTFHQPTTISSSILKTFHRENASTTSTKQKMLSKSSMNPEAGTFLLQE